MGTKLNPGKFDCYTKAAPDEPMFVLLARDPLAPVLVRLWAELREQAHGPTDKGFEAYTCAINMAKWYHEHQLAAAAPSSGEADQP